MGRAALDLAMAMLAAHDLIVGTAVVVAEDVADGHDGRSRMGG